VCRYDVQADTDGSRTGVLASASALSAELLARVDDELARSQVDPTCSRHEHTRFAVVTDTGGDWNAVALDGCSLMQGESWWRGTDGLRRLLGG
jgi:hypothetical protein